MLFVVAKLYIETLQNFFFSFFFRPSLHVEYERVPKGISGFASFRKQALAAENSHLGPKSATSELLIDVAISVKRKSLFFEPAIAYWIRKVPYTIYECGASNFSSFFVSSLYLVTMIGSSILCPETMRHYSF